MKFEDDNLNKIYEKNQISLALRLSILDSLSKDIKNLESVFLKHAVPSISVLMDENTFLKWDGSRVIYEDTEISRPLIECKVPIRLLSKLFLNELLMEGLEQI